MNELMIFGTMCLVIGAIVFAIAVSLSVQNSKGDDERLKESIGNLCWGAIIASLIVCGSMSLDFGRDIEKNIHNNHLETIDSIVDNTFTNKFE